MTEREDYPKEHQRYVGFERSALLPETRRRDDIIYTRFRTLYIEDDETPSYTFEVHSTLDKRAADQLRTDLNGLTRNFKRQQPSDSPMILISVYWDSAA